MKEEPVERIGGKLLSRYLKGFVLTPMDSREDWENLEDDYIIKRIYIQAQNLEASDWELVVYGETETLDHLYPSKDLYRMPFPHDLSLRKAMLRLVKQQPKFYNV